jgi:hypothetical protein
MSGEEWIIDSDKKLQNVLGEVCKMFQEHKYLRVKIETGMQRSLAQNAALHKYCELLAKELNDAGLDMKKVLTKKPDIPWSMLTVKEHLWKPIQEAMTGKTSTAQAEKKEYIDVYEVLNRHISGKFGLSVPWPCKDEEENQCSKS